MGYFHNLKDELTKVHEKLLMVDDASWSDMQKWKRKSCLIIIDDIIDNPDNWESFCPYNSEKIGVALEKACNLLLDEVTKDKVERLYALLIRFFIELYLSNSRYSFPFEPTSKLYSIMAGLKNILYSRDISNGDNDVYFAFYEMPVSILNFYMGNPGFKTFFEFDKRKEIIENSIGKYQQESDRQSEEVRRLEKKLDEYKTAFNFVGLSKGFENLLNQKEKAKKWAFRLMAMLAVSVLAPLVYKLFANTEITWQSILPVAGLELVLIYFFRVVLNHYYSIQTQIMQLELRQSLCQFIQSYAEYAKKIKANDKDALDKFENLIFSSILSNPDKVPGTFDGVDGLASLLKELKGK